MTIDADELERLRKAYVIFPDVLSLIAELKKARAISDEYHKRWLPLCVERDSARALLTEANLQLEYLDSRFPTSTTPTVRARIAAFLEKRP